MAAGASGVEMMRFMRLPYRDIAVFHKGEGRRRDTLVQAPHRKTMDAGARTRGKRCTMAIKIGNKAPKFTLPTYGDEKVALKDHEGKYVVVYFYPKDMTSGCTKEAEGFRDAAADLKSLNAVVFGISKDSVARHERFRDKNELNFQLLSDEDGKVIEKYEAWGEKKLYGKVYDGIIRSTVLVGPDGRVVEHWPKVRVKGHVEKVIEAIREHKGE